jgi:hypothetical protein
MTKLNIVCVVIALVGAAAVSAAAKPRVVELRDGNGQSVGTATVSESKSGAGVAITLNLKNLPPPASMPHTFTRSPSVRDQLSLRLVHISILTRSTTGCKIQRGRMRVTCRTHCQG